jgi:hypothetical protein
MIGGYDLANDSVVEKNRKSEPLTQKERDKLIDMFSFICDGSISIGDRTYVVPISHIREVFDKYGMSKVVFSTGEDNE